jgi:serine/threonine protein kinase/lipopolysaccharide biosynthesis regulator YciM
MIGQTISHYRIVEELGAGGMGVVYVAEDTLLERRVAIKTLSNARNSPDHRFRWRFLREARSISKLSHPHIATIYDYGETEDGQPYIVMELVQGGTLADLMLRQELTVSRSIEIIKQLAEALAEAHRHGIIHRDIKPSNIAIDDRGDVKVLDFGLAKELHPVEDDGDSKALTRTSEGVIVGTPQYLSPEQALGIAVDERSDVFTLGSVLYECISGHLAFPGVNQGDVRAKIIRDDPAPPSKLNRNIPHELDRITLKCLAKKPETRYQTATEVIADLNAVHATLDKHTIDQAITRFISPPTGTGALATLSELVRRPRLSVGAVLISVGVIGLLAWGLIALTGSKPHQPSSQAQAWYDVGTKYLREGDYFKATKPLEQAVASDEKFALAHARLAEAWSELDYSERAQLALIRVDGLVPNRSSLEEADALYLDAIRATITRDFSGAITAYTKLAKLKPNQAQTYLDLGRAFARNDEIEKALENFNLAIKQDPQYGPAFLHLGILYGRKEDLSNANIAFDKADSIFQTLSDFEGRAEVLYQRGALLNRIGKLQEAQDQLEVALDISRASNNEYQEIKTRLQLSTVLYWRGKTEQAKESANAAVTLAQNLKIENLATQGLIDLGNLYISRREYAEAERVLLQALDFAERNHGRRNEAGSQLTLAKLYIQQEVKTDEALNYLEKALNYFQQGGYNKEISQGILLRGRAKLLTADYNGALTDFQQQLQFAQQTNNQSQLASTYLLIGNLLEDLERYPEALRNFKTSHDIYKTLGVPLNVGYLLVNQSEMLWRIGKSNDARSLLAEVPMVADQLDSNYRKTLLARSELVRSQMALTERVFSEAKAASERSISLSGTTVSHTGVEGKYQLGLIQVRSGLRSAGLQTSQQAVELAKEIKDEHLLSLAILSEAEALLENGDAKRALEVALEAQQRFSRYGQQESEWQAWLIAARANHKLGDKESALDQFRQSKKTLAALEQKWGSESFSGYVNRQDVKAWRLLLDQSIAATQ